MKKMNWNLLVLSLLGLSLSSCNGKGIFSFEESLTFKGDPILNFDGSQQEQRAYWASNGYSNSGMFLSFWKKEAVQIKDGLAALSLYEENNQNVGSEIRTTQGYLYGYYGTRMKTFKKSGTVQSFFTYNGGRYAHDEIDIEFLGKDTTKVQFNYYHNGVGGHEYWYSLGFDSSEDFHDYGFLWEEKKITWFVDFKPVYALEAELPQWGYIFANVWAGQPSVYSWLGSYEKDDQKYTAYYDYFTYAEAPAQSEKPSSNS